MSTIFWWSPQFPLYTYDSLTTLYMGSLLYRSSHAVSLSLSLLYKDHYAVRRSLRLVTTLFFTTLGSSLFRFGFFVFFLGCPEVPPSRSLISLYSHYYIFAWGRLQGRGCSILFFRCKCLISLAFLVRGEGSLSAVRGRPCKSLKSLDFFGFWAFRHLGCIELRYLALLLNVPGGLDLPCVPYCSYSIWSLYPKVNP